MTLRLLTIGPSHYCEKARWALEHARIPFAEESHLPLVHWAFSVPRGSRTVPLLTGAGEALVESRDIVAYADAHAPSDARLYASSPEDRARTLRLERMFDDRLGPLARRLAYCFLVPRPALFLKAFEGTASPREKLALKHGHTLLRTALGKAFKVSARAQEKCVPQMEALLDEIGAELGANRYFVGNSFSAADLTFAALASPILLPDELGAAVLRRKDLPDDLGAIVDRFRATRAGQHALTIYGAHRSIRVAPLT
jgi:glutathione S-transferase